MNWKVLNFFLFSLVTVCNSSSESSSENGDNSVEGEPRVKMSKYKSDGNEDVDGSANDEASMKDCWVTLNAKHLFDTMDPLDESSAKARNEYQAMMESVQFDQEMLDFMIGSSGAAERAIHNFQGEIAKVPAGLNLGGHCMMRMHDSVLFFHRVKLRNDTIFRMNYLHNDLVNMRLIGRLSLNDLHLIGTYERALTDRDPSHLIYRPTFGNLELLLKNVEYKMEARYRLLKDRLSVELVVSEMKVSEILMTYRNNVTQAETERLESKNIEEYLERLRTDLNDWLKDYFNDFLMYYMKGIVIWHKKPPSAEFQKYDKEKAFALNKYTDDAIDLMNMRLHDLNATAIKIPEFSIYSVNGLEIKLRDGVLRGLDTMHRRSVATGLKTGNVRQVDALIGFSKIKIQYRYEANLNVGIPPLTGLFILSADELTAHLGMSLVQNPESVDLVFDNIQQKPGSLTVEGSINRMIANFKHLLENHITSIMTNMITHNVKMLRTLTKCEPMLPGYVESGEKYYSKEQDGDGTSGGKDGDFDGDGNNNAKDDYAVVREDSIELELPAESTDNKPIKMKIKYNEKFSLNEVKE